MTDTLSGVQDLLSRLLPADPALQRLRHGRDKVRQATQDSHDALFDAGPDQPLPLSTRHAVAFYVAVLNQQHALAEYHRRHLLAGDAAPRWLLPVEADDLAAIDDPQLQGILVYARILTLAPEQGDQAALQRLQALGLGPDAVVSLAQLVAFLAFEARLFGGLQAITEGGLRP